MVALRHRVGERRPQKQSSLHFAARGGIQKAGRMGQRFPVFALTKGPGGSRDRLSINSRSIDRTIECTFDRAPLDWDRRRHGVSLLLSCLLLLRLRDSAAEPPRLGRAARAKLMPGNRHFLRNAAKDKPKAGAGKRRGAAKGVVRFAAACCLFVFAAFSFFSFLFFSCRCC
jgi:hypothetical protein